jgi:hypothetical protein
VPRSETLLALLAVVLASVAAVHVPGRLFYALGAILILAYVCFARLRASVRRRDTPQGFSALDRAERIREERNRGRGER